MANFIFYSVGHNILHLYNISVQLRLFTSNTSLASVVTNLKYELPDELVNDLRLIIVFGNTRKIETFGSRHFYLYYVQNILSGIVVS